MPEKSNEERECETHCCGLGNSALLVDLSNPEYYDEFGDFSYENFSEIEFPTLKIRSINRSQDYLFNHEWIHEYPTFEDFIQRCQNFLTHRKPIKEFSYDSMGILA